MPPQKRPNSRCTAQDKYTDLGTSRDALWNPHQIRESVLKKCDCTARRLLKRTLTITEAVQLCSQYHSRRLSKLDRSRPPQKMNKLLLATALLSTAAAQVLETFDGSRTWSETNDPVMGGQSEATFTISKNTGVFDGTCKIVPSLKAPGFCSAQSDKTHLRSSYPDISKSKGLELVVRSTTPSFAGFKVAFATKHAKSASRYTPSGTFKAPFSLNGGAREQTVFIPFTDFSWDWSPYTGACDTKDPTGKQHHCCGEGDLAQYCPSETDLAELTGLELWAEGSEGDFHLEVKSIAAVAAPTMRYNKVAAEASGV